MSVRQSSNGSAETQMSPEMTRAYRLTGGYVDYLRENASRLLNDIPLGNGKVESTCEDLADFTAFTRAAPAVPDRMKPDDEPFREMPTRLDAQFCRLADCLAVVCQRKEVDWYVLRTVRKVAFDTSRGKTLKLLSLIKDEQANGAYTASLARWQQVSDEKMEAELKFLREIGAIENFESTGLYTDAHYRWRLSSRMASLWTKVCEK
jgi:hypothetical protein